MQFDEYQRTSLRTWNPPPRDKILDIMYLTLGVVGEAGEVAEKVKKILRNDLGVFSAEKKQELKKEIGDVIWYLSTLSYELGLSFDDVAQTNIDKLSSRLERGVIASEGDNR